MIDPTTRARTSELAATWRDTGSMRIERFLDQDIARELLESLRGLPHVIKTPSKPGGLHFLYFELALQPEADCDHITCRLARWWFDEGRSWLSELTGLRLAPPPDGRLIATAFSKGNYLDAHNDTDGDRVLAYVIGLSPTPWPAEDGGHLEFVDVSEDGREPQVIERRPPGWNTLDLFDVRRPGRVHRIPIVRDHHERRVFSGWFYRR